MATVVRLGKDTRAAEVGLGVGTFLTRMQDKRIDGLQQELMGLIGGAKDEAEATAFIGDPRFQEVVTDNNRMPAVVTQLNTAPLGKQSILGYTPNGEAKYVTFSERETPEEALAAAGLRVEKAENFAVYDSENIFSDPRSIGRFTNASAAEESQGDSIGSTEQVLELEIAISLASLRNQTTNTETAQARQVMDEIVANFNMDKPLTSFDALVRARDEGRLTDNQFDQAWKFISEKVGRTGFDLKDETFEDLELRGAALQSLAVQAKILVDKALSDKALISKVGGIDRFFESIGAEIEAAAQLTGITIDKDVEDFDFGSEFAGKSRAFKSMMLSFAVNFAASKGQTARSLSDKDLKLFMEAVGTGISNPEVFAQNLKELMEFEIAGFESYYTTIQGSSYQSSHPKFTEITRSVLQDQEAERDALMRQYGVEILGPKGAN